MIQKKTLFILGAGASIPYGFPSGIELRDRICGVTGGGNANNLLVKTGIASASTIGEFTKSFRHSKQLSIDTFLSKRTDLADLGKLFIAAELCSNESISRLLDSKIEDDWYAALWNTLQDGAHNVGMIGSNKVRFVTFNYDRSLECFLHQSALNSFITASHDEVHAAVSRLQIIHPYGHLGEFTWNITDTQRRYEPAESAQTLKLAASSLKVIPESREDDKGFQIIGDWVEWAQQICILGFGFDPLNMQRLGLEKVFEWQASSQRPIPHVVASVFGKTNAECADIHNSYFSRTINPNLLNEKNLMTLRETNILRMIEKTYS